MDFMNELVPDSSIRTFLLIENRLLREALVRLFCKRADLLVVGQSGYSDTAARSVIDSHCDVLVMDSLQREWLPAYFAVEEKEQIAFKTVLLARDPDEEQFLGAVRSGVTGYLLQDASASDVVSAVRAVFRGEAVCPPQLCSVLFRFVAQTPREASFRTPSPRPDLTLRQQQLVTLVAKGLTNKEIASHLNLSQFTVRKAFNGLRRLQRAMKTVRKYPRGQSSPRE